MLLYRENLVNSFIIPFFFKLRPSVCIGTSKQSLRNLKVTNHLLKGDYYSKVISSEKKTLRPYTAVSRKVLGKTVDATIPKGNMGYDQYTVPDDCSCRTYFCCFPLALENTLPWSFVANSFKFLWRTENSKPPTMPFVIVACTFSDNLSRNSCILTRGFTSHQSEVCSTIRLLQVFVYFSIEISLGLLNFTRKDW